MEETTMLKVDQKTGAIYLTRGDNATFGPE